MISVRSAVQLYPGPLNLRLLPCKRLGARRVFHFWHQRAMVAVDGVPWAVTKPRATRDEDARAPRGRRLTLSERAEGDHLVKSESLLKPIALHRMRRAEMMRSPIWMRSTTSMPRTTWPRVVKSPSLCGCGVMPRV